MRALGLTAAAFLIWFAVPFLPGSSVIGVPFSGVQAQTTDAVDLYWRQDGVRRSASFNPPTGKYIVGVDPPIVFVGWAEDTVSGTESLTFRPDGMKFTIRGDPFDLNGNGVLDFDDVVQTFNAVVNQ